MVRRRVAPSRTCHNGTTRPCRSSFETRAERAPQDEAVICLWRNHSVWQSAGETRYSVLRTAALFAAPNEVPGDTSKDQNGLNAGAVGAAPAAFLHHPWHHRGRRLCLAEGCQLAGGAARSLDPGRGYPQISRSGKRLHRKPARPHRRLAEEAGRGNARPDQGRRFQRARRRTGPMPICASSARAASTRCSAACRAPAARPRSFSTATSSRPTTNISSSAAPGIRRITSCKPGAPTSKARNIFRFACATGPMARTSTTWSRRPTARVVWSADGKSFFYVKLDDNHRPMQVWRHRLGTPQADDVLVYEEKDSGWFTHIHESSSGRFCVIAGGDHETSEQRLIDLADPDAPPRLVAAREEGVQYSVADRGDELFILTNADGAIDFKVVTAPLEFARARQLARPDPVSRGHLYHRCRDLCRPHGAAGARQCAARHHHPRPQHRRRARHRVRRGGLFAGHHGRL